MLFRVVSPQSEGVPICFRGLLLARGRPCQAPNGGKTEAQEFRLEGGSSVAEHELSAVEDALVVFTIGKP